MQIATEQTWFDQAHRVDKRTRRGRELSFARCPVAVGSEFAGSARFHEFDNDLLIGRGKIHTRRRQEAPQKRTTRSARPVGPGVVLLQHLTPLQVGETPRLSRLPELVWINLIGNAIKYGGTPPTVDVAARTTSDGMVRFEVVDNGDGVALDDRERISGEFERGSSAEVDGHGLGLAIVDRVVSRLDGETGIDTADSGGSVFWFTVPVAG